MTAAATFCLLYTACAGWFHSEERRTALSACRHHASARWLLRGASWCLAIGALAAMWAAVGFERGLPIWLVLLSLASLASLLVTALLPKRHVASAVGVYAVGLVLVGWMALPSVLEQIA